MPDGAAVYREVLSRPYLRVLSLSALLGVPIALACFFFVSLQHEVWAALPAALGYEEAPWWWPLPALCLAGLILAPVRTRMPGHGGHLPVDGLGGTPVGPRTARRGSGRARHPAPGRRPGP